MADFLDGHARVLAVVRAAHKERTGNERGAAAWLASKLGCTRQSVDMWGKRKGFPRKYAAKLMRITGLTEDEIWPGVSFRFDCPTEVWDQMKAIQKRTGGPPMSVVAVELIQIGLKSRSKS